MYEDMTYPKFTNLDQYSKEQFLVYNGWTKLNNGWYKDRFCNVALEMAYFFETKETAEKRGLDK